MEIRNQSIDHLELIARVDKNLRPPTRLMKHAVFIRSSFQGPCACRSHGDDPVSLLFCPVDLGRLRLLDPVELGMHVMF